MKLKIIEAVGGEVKRMKVIEAGKHWNNGMWNMYDQLSNHGRDFREIFCHDYLRCGFLNEGRIAAVSGDHFLFVGCYDEDGTIRVYQDFIEAIGRGRNTIRGRVPGFTLNDAILNELKTVDGKPREVEKTQIEEPKIQSFSEYLAFTESRARILRDLETAVSRNLEVARQ